MTTMTAQTTQVYRLFIKASSEQIWDAITKPEFTTRYFFASRVELSDGRRRAYGPAGELGGTRRSSRRTRRAGSSTSGGGSYDPELAEEETSRVTWEIEPQEGGYCLLTVVHDRLEGAPKTAESVAGGWMLVLSGLKTLLETGEPLAG